MRFKTKNRKDCVLLKFDSLKCILVSLDFTEIWPVKIHLQSVLQADL